MGSIVGCVLEASAVSPQTVKALASSRGVTALFVRGALRLPGLRGNLPVQPDNGRLPGLQLAEDDSALRAAIDAARSAGMDVHLVFSNPLAGSGKWPDLHARDIGDHPSVTFDPDRPSLCPNRPKLLKWLSAAAAEAVKTYRPAGVLLDDFSIGSPENMHSLFTCWCSTCQARAGELGYDTDRVRVGMQGMRTKLVESRPGAVPFEAGGIAQYLEAVGYDTGILDWLNFRADCVSALMYEVRKAVSGADPSARVFASAKAPGVAMLSGQRRADLLRDTTLADFCVPVICGPRSRLLETIAACSRLVKSLLPEADEARVLKLAAGLFGHRGLSTSATGDELARTCDAGLLTELAARELELAMAGKSEVPRCPAVDVEGLPPEAVSRIAGLIAASEAAGLIYFGAPD